MDILREGTYCPWIKVVDKLVPIRKLGYGDAYTVRMTG